MLASDIFSLVLLSALLFWTVYNGSIIYIGIKSKRKHIQSTNAPQEGKEEELPKFSIIVPTKNEEPVINRCLNAILDMNYPKDKMEVIIVDGNSSDATCLICEGFSAKHPGLFKIIKEKEAKGKPAALNLALPIITGEVVGVFDADSVPEKEALRKVASHFNDKQVMAVQGRTTSLNEKRNILTRVVSMEEKAWFQALLAGREKMQLFVPLTGSCQFIRRNELEELGGWDEASLTEDVELALRLVEKKHTIRYADEVCCGQETPNSLRDLTKQRIRWYRGYMETALKYGRLLDTLNKRTVDAEISLVGPFIMVISLLSYLNWLVLSLLFTQTSIIVTITGLIIILTAISLISIGVLLIASEKPIRLRNLLWVPSIYAYWLIQMCIAGWAFVKLIFRRKRVWSKTEKKGFISPNLVTD